MKIKEIVENIQAQGPNTQWTVKSSDAKGVTVVNKANPTGPQLTIPANQTSSMQTVKPHQFMVSKPNNQMGQQPTSGQPAQTSNTSGQPTQPNQSVQPNQQPGQSQSSTTQNAPMTGDMVEIPDNFFATETHDELDKFDKNDMMASGKNKDIGGDAGDEFIKQIVNPGAERFGRGIDKHARILPENDELDKWLTIAGLR
jgi:hypothetical protein